jgi:GcrA cell cycle regulator
VATSETPWTPALITELTQLWDEGLSTAAIARRLGLSKNAVVGKAHRLGLSRENPLHPAAMIAPAEPGGSGCRYPLWPHGAPPDFTYCGAPRDGALDSYCAAHRELCWVKPRPAQEAA